MPKDFKEKYMWQYFRLHRGIYVVLFSVVLSCQMIGLTENAYTLIYYTPVLIGCFFLDELYFRKQDRIPDKFHSLRVGAEIFLLSLGNLFGLPHIFVFISVMSFELLLCFEDLLLTDIFDDYRIFFRRVFYLSVMMIGMLICFRNEVKGPWIFVEILVGAVVVFFVYSVFHSYVAGVRYYEKQTTDLYFKYVNLQEDRDNLRVYQDRVESVNNEINRQKLDLMKANKDLATVNAEVRSLIDVMKEFTSSFDVERNARLMLENIMAMKEPGICGIFINKDIFLNEAPYVEILTGSEELYASLDRDFYSIFDKITRRGGVEPFIICNNKIFSDAVLSDTALINAVAIPAYENETCYGVLVIGSSSYDFFESGYSFYESSLMDFTAALRSAKLFLQMEDMARKDGLTHVYNRAYFNEIYPKIMANSIVEERSLCIALLDIDKFKSINDTYGHLAGDEVIKAVARMDHHYAKMYDGYAVRYGGEEFLLILQGKTVEEFRDILLEMQREIVSNIVSFEGDDIQVNVSMGMSHYPDIAPEIVDVLNEADQAMYFSKEHGRGLVVIYGKEEESLKYRNPNATVESDTEQDTLPSGDTTNIIHFEKAAHFEHMNNKKKQEANQ